MAMDKFAPSFVCMLIFVDVKDNNSNIYLFFKSLLQKSELLNTSSLCWLSYLDHFDKFGRVC